MHVIYICYTNLLEPIEVSNFDACAIVIHMYVLWTVFGLDSGHCCRSG